MKSKMWIIGLWAMFLLYGCKTTPTGYTVTGNITGFKGGKIYLIADANAYSPRSETRDTLGISVVNDGNFSFSGSVDSTVVAMIALEGMKGGIPVFLENTDYEVKIDMNDLFGMSIRGGDEQEVYNRFLAIDVKKLTEGSRLRAAMWDKEVSKDSVQRVLEDFNDKLAQEEKEVIRRYGNTLASAFRIRSQASDLSLEKLEEKYVLLGEKGKNTIYGRELEDWIRRLRATTPGAQAPDFKAMTPEGDSISLYSIKSKYKLIDFWASWCGPCRAEMPVMVEIYKDFHDKGLEILGVSLDSEMESWKEAIKKDGLTWLHCSDLGYWKSTIARLYVINAIPQTILLDENNRIVSRGLRGKELKMKLKELLP